MPSLPISRRLLTPLVLSRWNPSRFVRWLLLFLLAGSCTTPPPHRPTGLSITVHIAPSFDSAILVSLRQQDGRQALLFASTDALQDIDLVPQDSAALSDTEWAAFIAAIDTGVLRSLSPAQQRGLDGTNIEAKYVNGGEKHAFFCWSPGRRDNAAVYRLLDQLFPLLYHHFPHRESTIENVQYNLSYPLPIRTKSLHPLVARLYGDLSGGYEDALQAFFDSIPRDSAAIIDCSNFKGMGTLFYPYFRHFNKAHPKVVWVVSPDSRQELLYAGVDSVRLVSTLEVAQRRLH